MRPPFALLLLAVSALVCACGEGGRPAAGESRPPPGLAPRFMAPEGWAWGVVQPAEGPQVRYGVSVPPGRMAAAHVVVVPGRFESAETWFETAQALNAAGFGVWIIERPGHGGSGRRVRPHDLLHGEGPEGEAAVLSTMIEAVVRPAVRAPIVLLASQDAAAPVMLAARQGPAANRIVLSAPELAPPTPGRMALWADRIGLGALPAPGWRPWTRDFAPVSDGDPWRLRMARAWPTANPDLRLSGESLGSRARAAAADLSAPPAALLVLGADGGAAGADCAAPCRVEVIDGAGEAPHLAPQAVRDRWLAALIAFVQARTATDGD